MNKRRALLFAYYLWGKLVQRINAKEKNFSDNSFHRQNKTSKHSFVDLLFY